MSGREQDELEKSSLVPEWLRQAWEHAQRRGLDKLTMDEIDAEVDTYRNEKPAAAE